MIRSLPALFRVFLVALYLGTGATTFAQNATGVLCGNVADASGARIAGARVEVRAIGSSLTRDAASNERGEFRFDLLPPGKYDATVNSAGFAAAHSAVSVLVSSVNELAVIMQAAPIMQTVTVNQPVSSITTESIEAVAPTLQTVAYFS